MYFKRGGCLLKLAARALVRPAEGQGSRCPWGHPRRGWLGRWGVLRVPGRPTSPWRCTSKGQPSGVWGFRSCVTWSSVMATEGHCLERKCDLQTCCEWNSHQYWKDQRVQTILTVDGTSAGAEAAQAVTGMFLVSLAEPAPSSWWAQTISSGSNASGLAVWTSHSFLFNSE